MSQIATTATLRPELLEKTYKSFFENLFIDKYNYRIIINVDPIGSKIDSQKVVLVAKKFCNNVIYNVSDNPNFAKAWKWCWDQVESDFVFHLEEDWELLSPVEINKLIDILNDNETLATLRLIKMNVPKNLRFFRSKYIVREGFLQAENRSVSFGGNPQLIKSEFVKQARNYMVLDRNPEKQFRKGAIDLWNNVVSQWDYGVYTAPKNKALVKDIGKEWMVKNKFRKKSGAGFVVWEKY